MLGYPSSYERGGYAADEFRGLGVPLPPTVDEDLRDKPTVHSLMKLGQTAYIGALDTTAARSRTTSTSTPTCTASWTRRSAGSWPRSAIPADPASLRSRTVIARTSDHGELGLSHGGLRQKMFNAYEESIRVPLVVSNPVLFPEPRESDALVSLVDLVPTLLGLAGAAPDPERFDGHDLGPLLRGEQEQRARRGAVHLRRPPGGHGVPGRARPAEPDPLRARPALEVRDLSRPHGRAAPEYELYDLETDPDEAVNLADKRTGRGRTRTAEGERLRLHALTRRRVRGDGTLTPRCRR